MCQAFRKKKHNGKYATVVSVVNGNDCIVRKLAWGLNYF